LAFSFEARSGGRSIDGISSGLGPSSGSRDDGAETGGEARTGTVVSTPRATSAAAVPAPVAAFGSSTGGRPSPSGAEAGGGTTGGSDSAAGVAESSAGASCPGFAVTRPGAAADGAGRAPGMTEEAPASYAGAVPPDSGGLEGDGSTTGAEGVPARSPLDERAGPAPAGRDAAGAPACPREGVYSPDQFGLLGSGKLACWIVGSPVPRLIVSRSDGTGSMPIGWPFPGMEERDCAHPARARPSIPTAILRFMVQ
jgi:hypothetical protein